MPHHWLPVREETPQSPRASHVLPMYVFPLPYTKCPPPTLWLSMVCRKRGLQSGGKVLRLPALPGAAITQTPLSRQPRETSHRGKATALDQEHRPGRISPQKLQTHRGRILGSGLSDPKPPPTKKAPALPPWGGGDVDRPATGWWEPVRQELQEALEGPHASGR